MNKWKRGDVFVVDDGWSKSTLLLSQVTDYKLELISLETGNRWSARMEEVSHLDYRISDQQLYRLLTPNYVGKAAYLGNTETVIDFSLLYNQPGTSITLPNTLVGTAGGYDFEM